MRIEAQTPEELIKKSEDKKEGLLLLDKAIRETAPHCTRWLLKSDTYVMLGYGRMKDAPEYPLIAIAPQKQNISVYIEGEKDGVPLIELYREKLGKVSTGKCCIRIRNMKSFHLDEWKDLIRDCDAWNQK